MIDRDFQVQWTPVLAQTPSTGIAAETCYSSRHQALREFDDTRWCTRMLGKHQAVNLGAAVTAVCLLRQLGYNLPNAEVSQSLSVVQPSARLEVVGEMPVQVIDTAHNPVSVAAGLDAMDVHFPRGRRLVVLSCSRDKDYGKMLELLLAWADEIVITAFLGNPRAVPIDELLTLAQTKLLNAESVRKTVLHTADKPSSAFKLAQQLASSADVVYATGSFFLAAEILAELP